MDKNIKMKIIYKFGRYLARPGSPSGVRSSHTNYTSWSLCSSLLMFFFFSSRRRHTRCLSDWSSDVCSSDLICRRLGLERDLWPKAATLLILPTLILDPFSCAFFTTIFPNLDPGAAGAFGGWILICCGGGTGGVGRKP